MIHPRTASHLKVVRHSKSSQDRSERLNRLRGLLKIDPESSESFAESIPFSVHDTTIGAENELQTVVIGSKDQSDLPLFIRSSNY